MTRDDYRTAWHAGYLRGLASQPGIPLDIQQRWADEDYGDRCRSCGRDSMDRCSMCEDGRREDRETREIYERSYEG